MEAASIPHHVADWDNSLKTRPVLEPGVEYRADSKDKGTESPGVQAETQCLGPLCAPFTQSPAQLTYFYW